MARDKLKDFLRRNPSGSPDLGNDRIVYEIDHGGDQSADPYVDDLKASLKSTLGDYVSDITKGDNRYPLKPGSNSFRLQGDDGQPGSYNAGESGAEKSYFQRTASPELDDADLRSYFDQISGGGSPDGLGGGTFDAEEIQDVLDKSGKNVGKSGHDVLEKARDKKLISPVLTQNNRFHPDGSSPYNASGEPMTAGQVDNLPFASEQSELGEYDENSTAVKLKALKKIGDDLMVAGTGHNPSTSAFLAGLLPSLQQLGATKLDPNDVRTRSVANPGFGGGNRETKGSSVTKSYDSWSKKSFGHLNSPLEPFGGTPRLGMTTLAIALVLVVGLLVDIVAMILGALILPLPSSGKIVSSYNNIIKPKNAIGKWFEGDGAAILPPSFFGVRPTKMDFVEAVSLGTEIYFGEVDAFKGEGGGLFSFLPGGKNINDSPGYYSIVFRTVIRSTIEIGLAFGKIFGNGLFAALGAIADLFDTIRNSKLVAYCNMLAALGDIYEDILIENDAGKIILVDKKSGGVIGTKVSALDATVLKAGNQEIRAGKSRYTLNGTDDTLVWRAGAPPSAYLIDPGTAKAQVELGNQSVVTSFGLEDPYYAGEFKEFFEEQGVSPHKQHLTDTGRLTPEVVKAVEDASEGEYMPFYFHDLRTNEIVSFHAFLTTLTDAYTANYDSNQGYGRADPVMIYNNTQRTIGLSFWVVSTNSKDFDEMWWKINKLTSLMYPQYSGGTKITQPDINDGKPFTAPFSQVISASPMIRLRLGDLLKSNYSKFGLARIFGTPDMEDSDATALTQDAWNTIIEQTEDVKSYLDGKAVPEYAKPPLLGPLTTEFTTMREVEVLALKDEKSKIRKVKLPPGLNVKITSINPTVESLAKFLETGDLDDISSFGIAEVEVSGPSWEGFFRKGVDNAEDVTRYNTFKAGLAMRGLSEKDIIIPHYLLAKPGIFKPNPVKVPDPPADAPSTTTTSDLLSSENNPFVRAFESTRGRGLAGFITQMDFQWLDQVTWETAPGSKAPKTCVVTISFSPVHDIGPGTDHRGMNRAPIYNVGRSVKHLGRDPYDDES